MVMNTIKNPSTKNKFITISLQPCMLSTECKPNGDKIEFQPTSFQSTIHDVCLHIVFLYVDEGKNNVPYFPEACKFKSKFNCITFSFDFNIKCLNYIFKSVYHQNFCFIYLRIKIISVTNVMPSTNCIVFFSIFYIVPKTSNDGEEDAYSYIRILRPAIIRSYM